MVLNDLGVVYIQRILRNTGRCTDGFHFIVVPLYVCHFPFYSKALSSA
jgi:hypothetical protein